MKTALKLHENNSKMFSAKQKYFDLDNGPLRIPKQIDHIRLHKTICIVRVALRISTELTNHQILSTLYLTICSVKSSEWIENYGLNFLGTKQKTLGVNIFNHLFHFLLYSAYFHLLYWYLQF